MRQQFWRLQTICEARLLSVRWGRAAERRGVRSHAERESESVELSKNVGRAFLPDGNRGRNSVHHGAVRLGRLTYCNLASCVAIFCRVAARILASVGEGLAGSGSLSQWSGEAEAGHHFLTTKSLPLRFLKR